MCDRSGREGGRETVPSLHRRRRCLIHQPHAPAAKTPPPLCLAGCQQRWRQQVLIHPIVSHPWPRHRSIHRRTVRSLATLVGHICTHRLSWPSPRNNTEPTRPYLRSGPRELVVCIHSESGDLPCVTQAYPRPSSMSWPRPPAPRRGEALPSVGSASAAGPRAEHSPSLVLLPPARKHAKVFRFSRYA